MDIQEEIKQRGVLEGRKQGMQQGIQQGMQQGIQRGVQQGVQQGMQKVALSMLQKQADIAFISEVTGLPETEIIKLKNGS